MAKAVLPVNASQVSAAGILGLSWATHPDRDITFNSSATLATGSNKGLYIFRDLTLAAGVVLTCATRVPTIIVCRDLSFGSSASEITATGTGPAGGASTSLGGKGSMDHIVGVATSQGLLSEAAMDQWFVAGGVGGAADNPGGAGAVGVASNALSWWQLILLFQQLGIEGGGGGGAGGKGSSTGTGGAAGAVPGQAGTDGSSIYAGGGGGSGIAGGGGGGGGRTVGAANNGGAGGAGGGIVVVICRRVLGAAGLVRASGADSALGLSEAGVGGGGGGGLAVLVALQGGDFTPTLTAAGGVAGAVVNNGGAGGNGGAGVTQLIGFDAGN